MEQLPTSTPIPSSQTESRPPRNGPPYGFYIGLGVFTFIITIAFACCWRVNHRRRGRCRACDQPGPASINDGSPSNPQGNITEPQQAYLLPSSETLPLYRSDHDFTKQLLQAWASLETPTGTRPPSYRSRLTMDLEVAVKNIATNDR